ncbi:MAG: MFS transporter [Pseudomonadota bacterium]|nr:MFS transporter [Pseudomonadota bacterium]
MSLSISPPNNFALLWVVATGLFMQALDTTILNTALPAIARGVDASPLSMHPAVVSYALVMAMLTPASGWLADRFGLRTTYLGAIGLFAAGSLLCALSESLPMLVAARALQGAGGSMLVPVGRLTLLRTHAAANYIAALATVTVAGQIGQLIGPSLGGWLVEQADWRWIFLINLPIALFGGFAAARVLPNGRIENVEAFDLRGCALLSLAMVFFSLGLDAPVDSDKAAWSLALIGSSAVAVGLYAAHAVRAPFPLFRPGLLRVASFRIGLAGNLLARVGSSAVPFLLPLLLQLQLGYAPFAAGLMLVPAALAGVVAKSRLGGLVARHGYARFLGVNTPVLGLSIASFALITPDWPIAAQLAQLAVFGAASAMQLSAMNGVTLTGLRPADASSGNSLFSMVQMLAMGLGVTVGGGLVELLSEELASTTWAFRYAFLAVGSITLASGVVFRGLRGSTDVQPSNLPRSGQDPA